MLVKKISSFNSDDVLMQLPYRERKISQVKFELGEAVADRIADYTKDFETKIGYGFIC